MLNNTPDGRPLTVPQDENPREPLGAHGDRIRANGPGAIRTRDLLLRSGVTLLMGAHRRRRLSEQPSVAPTGNDQR
jgi:hypothetical protein